MECCPNPNQNTIRSVHTRTIEKSRLVKVRRDPRYTILVGTTLAACSAGHAWGSGIGAGACKCRQPVSGPIAEAIEMRRNGMKEGMPVRNRGKETTVISRRIKRGKEGGL